MNDFTLLKKASLTTLSVMILIAVSSCSVSTSSSDNKPESFTYTSAENNGAKDNLNNPDPEISAVNNLSYYDDVNFVLNYKQSSALENALDTTVYEKRLRSIDDVDNELLRSIERKKLKKLIIAYNLNSIYGTQSPFYRICRITDKIDFDIVFDDQVTDISGLFEGCTLSTLPKSMDFSRVTSMTKMFANTIINTPLKINAPSVTRLDNMFMGAKLNNKISFTPETRPVSVAGMFEEALFAPGVMAPHMDTSRVTEMQGMFRKAKNLKTIPAYNTAMVSNMSEMFRGSSVSEIPNLDTPKALSMKHMFTDTVIDAPLNINAPSVYEMDGMFMGAKLNNKISFTPETRPVSVVSMFEETYFAPDVSVPNLDLSRVTSMQSMFCNTVINYPLDINAPAVTGMDRMFKKAQLNREISFTAETRPVSVAGMFEEASFAPGVSAPFFDTSNVTDMGQMFKGSKNIQTVPAYNTARVSSFFEMFRGSSVSEVPVFDTSNAKNMAGMFAGTSNLKDIPELNMTGVDCPDYGSQYTDSGENQTSGKLKENCRRYLIQVAEKQPAKKASGEISSKVQGIICIIALPICASVLTSKATLSIQGTPGQR